MPLVADCTIAQSRPEVCSTSRHRGLFGWRLDSRAQATLDLLMIDVAVDARFGYGGVVGPVNAR
jgi:hypothetical protein